jgi:chromosome segregation ATPase
VAMILSCEIRAKEPTVAPITKKDLSDVLTDFYGKVIEPRFDRLEKRLDEHDKKFADLLAHFDQIYSRLDRLETEYFTITAALQRLEDSMGKLENRMGRIEEKLDKEIALRERLEREVSDLKQRVIALQARIEEIENHLKTIS